MDRWDLGKEDLMKPTRIEICAVLCIVVGINFPFILRYWEGGWAAEYTVLATAGDWLGGTSAPLFSLAGFLMMYGAYKMQQEDLRLTREEMQQTRKEFETQNTTLKRHEFETTFFHLLELHHQIVNSILYYVEAQNITERDYTYHGRQYFSWVYQKMSQSYKNERALYDLYPSMRNLSPQQFDAKCLQKILLNIFPEIEINIGHYFKNIFQTLRLLDKSILSAEEKIDFAKLLSAQLSNDELNLCFYRCIYNIEDEELRDLVCRYGIFDTMNPKTLLNEAHLIWLDSNYC